MWCGILLSYRFSFFHGTMCILNRIKSIEGTIDILEHVQALAVKPWKCILKPPMGYRLKRMSYSRRWHSYKTPTTCDVYCPTNLRLHIFDNGTTWTCAECQSMTLLLLKEVIPAVPFIIISLNYNSSSPIFSCIRHLREFQLIKKIVYKAAAKAVELLVKKRVTMGYFLAWKMKRNV